VQRRRTSRVPRRRVARSEGSPREDDGATAEIRLVKDQTDDLVEVFRDHDFGRGRELCGRPPPPDLVDLSLQIGVAVDRGHKATGAKPEVPVF